MFAVDCPVHGCRVLLSSRSILGIDRRAWLLEVRYRCRCGHEGVWRPAVEMAG